MVTSTAREALAEVRWMDVLVSLGCLVVFLLGLVAPLTPSRGCPGITAVAVFVAGPVLLLAWTASRSAGLGRIALYLQALLTAGAELWLLARIGCTG